LYKAAFVPLLLVAAISWIGRLPTSEELLPFVAWTTYFLWMSYGFHYYGKLIADLINQDNQAAS